MDTKHIRLIIELLKQQLIILEEWENVEKLETQLEQARYATRSILMDHGGQLHYEIDYMDDISRLSVLVNVDVNIKLDEEIPEQLPPDIFLELHGKSVDEMINILRGYDLSETAIKTFLRRILPADDVL